WGLAVSFIDSSLYQDNYGFVRYSPDGTAYNLYFGFDVSAAFENALGRLPTAEEMATFDQYLNLQTVNDTDLATMAVALAQYATDQGVSNNRTSIDANQGLVSSTPQWISPASQAVDITTSGTYSYSNQWVIDGTISVANGGALTMTGGV